MTPKTRTPTPKFPYPEHGYGFLLGRGQGRPEDTPGLPVRNPIDAVIANTRSEDAMDLGSTVTIAFGVRVEDSYDIALSNCDVRFHGGCAR